MKKKQSDRSRARRVLLICAAAVLLSLAALAAALHSGKKAATSAPAAQDVTIPGARGDIPATVQLPAGAAQGAPLVVLCHGFTGNRGGDGHFAPLAQDLAAQGIASVRLDLPGCGDSAEPYTAYTLANMAADVDSVIEYMRTTYGVGKAALVGHSMGGRLASLYPQRGQYDVAALVLWSPANGTGLQGLEFLNVDDPAAVEALAAEAEANGQVTAWGVPISADFVREMRESDPNAALRSAALPTLLTWGGQDTVLSAETQSASIETVQALAQGQVVTEPFAAGDHNYLSADAATATALDQALRQTTVDFLTQYLK